MLEKIKNTKKYKKLAPYLDIRVAGLIVFGVIMLLVAWGGLGVLQTNYELEKKIHQFERRNEVAKLENENMALENKYLESDQYLEINARRQFNKALPGEKLYFVPENVALSKTVDLVKREDKEGQEQSKLPKYEQNLHDWRSFLLHQE